MHSSWFRQPPQICLRGLFCAEERLKILKGTMNVVNYAKNGTHDIVYIERINAAAIIFNEIKRHYFITVSNDFSGGVFYE